MLLLILAAIGLGMLIFGITYVTYRRFKDRIQFKPRHLEDATDSSPIRIKVAARPITPQSLPGVKISHSLPEITCETESGHKGQPPTRQITLPVTPTRHQTFQRQLSRRVEPLTIRPDPTLGSDKTEDDTPPRTPRTVESVLGHIQPELYVQEENLPEITSISGDPNNETCGELHFSLKYDPDMEALVVRIIEAKNLPAKDLTGFSDPYIKVYLLPERRQKFQTRVHRKNLNPVFNETFVFPCGNRNELQGKVLQFSVYDFDRFARNDLIGHVRLKRLTEGEIGEEVYYAMGIEGVIRDKENLGDIMLSLCYLPTAGRLTVTVVKARGLKPMDINGLSDPYVKVILVCQGKRIKKRKTSIKRSTLNPVFNEALVFDVPLDNVNDVDFAVKVVDYDRVGLNELMGCCAIGTSAPGIGHDHWISVMEHPREPVAQWYSLTDSLPAELDPPRTPSMAPCIR